VFGRGRRDKAHLRLHIGCGDHRLEGWQNIDSKALPQVDRVLDIRDGLDYSDVDAIYAEHFLEHLRFDDGLAFLAECRRVLRPEGILRLSTPNLDWVMSTHYRILIPDPQEGLFDAFRINRAFHGWGHQFLYNRHALTAVLHATGYRDVVFQRYGESAHEFLRGVEGHETWVDSPDLPHVLVAEASGQTPPKPLPEDWLAEFRSSITAR
jgi:predicted SAM-dependent methyltransferase